MSGHDEAVHHGEQPVAWRDTFDVWPSLRVEVQVAPWLWRFRWYRDELEPVWRLDLGPLAIDFGANRGYFPLERVPTNARDGAS